VEIEHDESSAHDLRRWRLGAVDVRIRRDYDRWFVDLGAGDQFAPASFWVHAAEGVPDPPTNPAGSEWWSRLTERLPRILADCDAISGRVGILSAQYRAELQEHLRRRAGH
jgi:hypothetical protein